MGSRAGLDVCREEKMPCLHTDSNPEPSILLRVFIPTTLSEPYSYRRFIQFPALLQRFIFLVAELFYLLFFLVDKEFIHLNRLKSTLQTILVLNRKCGIFNKWKRKNVPHSRFSCMFQTYTRNIFVRYLPLYYFLENNLLLWILIFIYSHTGVKH